MRSKKALIIEQLDNKIVPFQKTRDVLVPDRGWIHTIRTSLNMTLAQLGERLNITKQGVKRIEDSEAKGSITLNTLKDVANAMELQMVYGLIPKDGSIDDLIKQKAQDLASKIVLRTHQNMKLEDQGINDEKIEEAIKELTMEIKRDLRRSIWD